MRMLRNTVLLWAHVGPQVYERGTVRMFPIFLKSMAILEKKLNGETQWDREMVEYLYSDLAPHLEKKPYPTVTAIQNVFELARHRDPEANEVNPLSLWNMHYLRQLDDSGFIDGLYA